MKTLSELLDEIEQRSTMWGWHHDVPRLVQALRVAVEAFETINRDAKTPTEYLPIRFEPDHLCDPDLNEQHERFLTNARNAASWSLDEITAILQGEEK